MNLVFKYLAYFAVLLFLSCNTGNTQLMKVVDGQKWNDEISIEYLNQDTVTYRSAYIVLRYNGDFEAKKVECVVTSVTPYQLCYKEDFTFYPAKDRQVTSVSSVEKILYRTQIYLKDKGYYIFTVKPKEEYSGVEMVGFIIE